MKTATATIEGVSPISFSRQHQSPWIEGEMHDAYEKRTWREKSHYDTKTLEVFIPGIVLKFAVDYTAKQLGIKIPGRGTKTWAKVIESGVICAEPIMLGVKRDALQYIDIQCHPKAIRGPGPRVERRFPYLQEWKGVATFIILNDMITEDIFKLHLVKSGQFCGLGRYAPRVGGHLGRFSVSKFVWNDEAEMAA